MPKLETVETPKLEAVPTAEEVARRNEIGKRTGCIPKIRTLENILYHQSEEYIRKREKYEVLKSLRDFPQLPESLHRQARRNHVFTNPVRERHLALFVIVLIFFLLPF